MRREPRQEGVEHGRAQHLPASARGARSEEHTSELQSPCNLVCRLLLEKKKTFIYALYCTHSNNPAGSYYLAIIAYTSLAAPTSSVAPCSRDASSTCMSSHYCVYTSRL